VLGGTGQLHDMIDDRCIPIALKRKSRSEQVERLRRREANEIAAPLRARTQAWAAQHLDELAQARPGLPDQLDDRGQDIVESLLAVADVAGREWPERARRAVVELRGDGVGDDDLGVELLADIKRAFDSIPDMDRISTEDLIVAVCRDHERPWSTHYRGDHITARQLAGLLREFGIKSKLLRVGETRFRGYQRDWFEDAWSRYLPPSVQNGALP
jgi:putative DNA primase/helicase